MGIGKHICSNDDKKVSTDSTLKAFSCFK